MAGVVVGVAGDSGFLVSVVLTEELDTTLDTTLDEAEAEA